jgi:hypothetical protein
MHEHASGSDLETIDPDAPLDSPDHAGPAPPLAAVGPDGLTRRGPTPRGSTPRLASIVAVIAVAGTLGVSLYGVVDLRRQRDDLKSRVASGQRAQSSLSRSLSDLQNSPNAVYEGGTFLALPTAGALRAEVALVFLRNPRAAQSSLWLLLHATGADPAVYDLLASSCSPPIHLQVTNGVANSGELQLAAPYLGIPDQGSYTVVLQRGGGPAVAGIRIGSDRSVTPLPAGAPGC